MNQIYQIALNTYRESIRSRVLYSLLFFAALMVIGATLFGSVTIGDQAQVIKDFGLMSISLFSMIFTVITGASLLHKELYRKTIYNILGKSVARWKFLLGKQLGLVLTVSLVILLMTTFLILFCGLFEGSFDLLLLQSAFTIICEMIVVSAATLLFSSLVVTPMLSGLFSVAVFFAGRSVEYIPEMVAQTSSAPIKSILKLIYNVLPHLDTLNIGNEIVYGHAVSAQFLILALVYSVAYAAVLLALTTAIFARRQFN